MTLISPPFGVTAIPVIPVSYQAISASLACVLFQSRITSLWSPVTLGQVKSAESNVPEVIDSDDSEVAATFEASAMPDAPAV